MDPDLAHPVLLLFLLLLVLLPRGCHGDCQGAHTPPVAAAQNQTLVTRRSFRFPARTLTVGVAEFLQCAAHGRLDSQVPPLGADGGGARETK